MKKLKNILPILTFIFMVWAVMEQTKAQPNIWIQVVGVALFFYTMMRLMQKTPSNFASKGNEELTQKETEHDK